MDSPPHRNSSTPSSPFAYTALIDTSTSRASTPSAVPASRTFSPPLLSSGTASSLHPRNLKTSKLLDSLSLASAVPPSTIPLRTWHATGPVFGHPSPLRPAIFSVSRTHLPSPWLACRPIGLAGQAGAHTHPVRVQYYSHEHAYPSLARQ